MGCLRCGRETEESGVFCRDCLQDMKDHPVPPRTMILLPKRKEEQNLKKPVRRKALGLEEQLKRVKKQLRNMTIMMVVFAMLAGFLGVTAWQYYQKSLIRPGQNYSSATGSVVPKEK